MPKVHAWESDMDVDKSVEEVRTALFARLRSAHPRRRLLVGVGAAVAGLSLFAGGIAFGAAAYASPGRSSTATATSPSTAPALSVSCFASARAKDPSSIQQYQNPTDTASKLLLESAKANPAQTCVTQLNQRSEVFEFGNLLEKGIITGVDCGVITATTVPALYFELKGGAYQLSGGLPDEPDGQLFAIVLVHGYNNTVYRASFRPPATSLPSSCATITLSPLPSLSATMLGACSVDAHHVNVYVRGTETAAEVCERHGYKAWSN